MRIEFTVRGPTGSRDIAIEAEPSDRLGPLLRQLADIAGAGDHQPWLGGRPLETDALLGGCGLRHGAVVDFGTTPPPDADVGLWSVQVVAGGLSRQPTPVSRRGVTVGRDPLGDIVLDDIGVSRRHARLEPSPSGVVLRDCGSTNGTTVDGVSVTTGAVADGALVRVGNSVLTVRSSTPGPRAAVTSGADGTLRVLRAPTVESSVGPVVVPDAEAEARPKPGPVQWLAALLPGVAGAVLAVATSTPLFLLFAALSPVMVLGGALGDRLHWRRARRRDALELRRRRAGVAQRVADELRTETLARREALPDVARLRDIALLPEARLWRHGDAHQPLTVRVGTADLPASTKVSRGGDETSAGTVQCVPLALDLHRGVVGLAGPVDDVRGSARWLIAQLATLYAPSDVSLLVVAGPVEPGIASAWHWCRWLPHLSGPATIVDDAVTELSELVVRRERETAERPDGPWGGSWTVVVVDCCDLPGDADTALLAATLARGQQWGVTGIWLTESPRDVPADCRVTVVPDDAGAQRRVVRRGDDHQVISSEQLSITDADEVARALAPLTDIRTESGLPEQCRLGALLPHVDGALDANSVRDAWSRTDGGATTPLGLGPAGPVVVDFARDGPHALVVGTTGSGKSELLRSVVLGLAIGQPPDELRFMLIDYKGGAAFADIARLPHADGVVTDLDADLTSRALRSLGAELRRRERLFAGVGAADIDAYRTRRGREATVARLFIVVDEFAELASEQPEFVSGLVGVARRGRSLGVHLIMATQRPGAAFSPEIRANTAIRIALRVTEPVESIDAIAVDGAAKIPSSLPGRCLVRIGDVVTEVQTARVTASDRGQTSSVELLGPWRQPYVAVPSAGSRAAGNDHMRRLVDLLRDAAVGLDLPSPPWLRPLPAMLSMAEVASDRIGRTADDDGETGVAVGRLDLPDEQSQPTLRLPARGGVAIVGRARSGRTTALLTAGLTLVEQHSPDDVHLHVVDVDGALTGMLAGLPHLGTGVSAGDSPELVARLLRRLAESDPRPGHRTVLLVDDWDAVIAAAGDAEGLRLADALTALLRTGAANVLIVVTGGRTLLMPRLLGGFGTRLLLALDDGTDYGMAGIGGGAVPNVDTTTPPGRGVRAPDGARFQLGLVAPDADGTRGRVSALAARFAGHPSAALRLRALPTHVDLMTLRRSGAEAPGLLIGAAGDRALPCRLDLVGRRGRLLIAGPSRSGRTNAVAVLIREALRHGHGVAFWAPQRSSLRDEWPSLLVRPGASPPDRPTLIVVDDIGRCDDQTAQTVAEWARTDRAPLAVVVAGRSDELASSFLELASLVRREQCGLLLRPGPLDGDLLGLRLTPPARPLPPGRGLLVVDPNLLVGPDELRAEASEPLPVQVAAVS